MNFFRGLGWAILFSACLYFAFGTVYYLGKRSGLAEAKCQLHNCMEYVIRYNR